MSNITNIVAIAVIVVLLTILPLWLPTSWIANLFFCFILLIFVEMWNLLANFAGIVSLGQQAFIGLGGYTVAVCITYWGLPAWISIVLAGILATILTLAISPIFLKMKGTYFAISTLIFAVALHVWFVAWDYTGGSTGMSIKINIPLTNLYYASLGFAVLFIFSVWVILRSNLGLKLVAVGDDEDAAETIGIDVFRTKLFCFLVANFATGLAGALFFLYPAYISPKAAFDVNWILMIIAATLFGGERTIIGPVLGTIIIVLIRQYLIAIMPGLGMLIYGVIIVALVSLAPGGVMKALSRLKSKFARVKRVSSGYGKAEKMF